MHVQNDSTEWLSSDAIKLILVLDIFVWVLLLLASNGAVDFYSLYTSGGVILEGHRTQLFDIQTQTEFQHRVFGTHALLPFNHLAYESILFVPLAIFPLKLALWIWRCCSVGMLFLSSRFLAHAFQGTSWQAFILSMFFLPAALAVSFGQDSILVLLLLALTLIALLDHKDMKAGTLLALAMFKPHLVLPLAVFLVWKRGARFLQGFAVGAGGVLTISTAITGLQGWRQLGELMRYAAYGTGTPLGGPPQIRPDLRGIFALLGVRANTALILTVVISALIFLIIAWRLRSQQQPEVLLPPLVAYTLLGSIYINAHDLTILLVAVFGLLCQQTRLAQIVAAACFCFPLFRLIGHDAWFFFVMCAVLIVTSMREAVPSTNVLSNKRRQWSTSAGIE